MTLAVAMLGALVTVATERAGDGARLERLLAPFAIGPEVVVVDPVAAFSLARPPGDDDVVALSRDGRDLARGPWAAMEAFLLAELNALALDAHRGLAVHAGVVATGERLVCFPGASGTGKSTMTAACLGAGFEYVSDEALCVDPGSGLVVPYPRPVALSPRSCELIGRPRPVDLGGRGGLVPDGREVLFTAADLGSRPVADARPLTDVVVLVRGASELHLEPRHRSEAVPLLLSMAFNHYKDPDASMATVAELAREARVWRLHLDDPRPAAARLAEALGD